MKLRSTLTTIAVVAAVGVPSADAMSVSHLVHKAHGHPYACDMDHDGRWGQKQLQCVIIVVLPHQWERWGLRVGKCESGGDHYEAAPPPNPSSGARGLFQFLASTWKTTPQYKAAYRVARRGGLSPSKARQYAAGKVDDPVRDTQGASWLVRTSGPSQWDCR